MEQKNIAQQAFLREQNLSAVLKLIYGQAPISRAQLATRTGLNKSTVSSLVEDLLTRRLIHETGINSNGAGRPATLLEINPQVGAVIGVELGVDFVAVVLTDFLGAVLWRSQIHADAAESQDETIGDTRAVVDNAIEVCREKDLRILGLSFSIPGTVDLEKGVLIFAPNLNWRDVPIRDLFSSTGLKVFIENDANAAAVGEHLFGVAQDLKDFIFVFAGVGLGGGLFLNDQLYRGKGGYAGEIGHTAILAEPFQQACHCGHLGCWETYANQASIIRRVQARIDASKDESSLIPSLMEQQHAPLSLSIIKQAAEAGDRNAIDSLAEAGAAMGSGIASLVNILNTENIILGGPISVAGDYLMPSILSSVDKQAMHEIVVQTEIKLSAFGADASLIGAAAVVVNDILTNPSHAEKEVVAGAEMNMVIA
jgi:glucokinase-like ROK family protein